MTLQQRVARGEVDLLTAQRNVQASQAVCEMPSVCLLEPWYLGLTRGLVWTGVVGVGVAAVDRTWEV